MNGTRGKFTMPFFLQSWKLPALLLLTALVSSCAGSGPYNTTSDGEDTRLMLTGHDPVAYFTLGKHALGRAEIKAEHDGVTYRFMTSENKAMFLKEPSKYVPQFGGYCANGIAYGIPWGGDADTWKLIGGKLYIFGGGSSKNYFLMDEAMNLALADRYWADEVKGSIGVVQRYKRLVLRAPHYRTGKELETEWQKRQQPR